MYIFTHSRPNLFMMHASLSGTPRVSVHEAYWASTDLPSKSTYLINGSRRSESQNWGEGEEEQDHEIGHLLVLGTRQKPEVLCAYLQEGPATEDAPLQTLEPLSVRSPKAAKTPVYPESQSNFPQSTYSPNFQAISPVKRPHFLPALGKRSVAVRKCQWTQDCTNSKGRCPIDE